MPLYEYKCQSCGEVFETIQKFSDEPLSVHEKCGGQVERLISTSALKFKGSGWYVNDYGKGNSGAPKADPSSSSKSDKSEKSDKANGSSTSTETSSKPDSSSKSESKSSTTATKSDSKS